MPNPTAVGSLVEGLKKYKSSARHQLTHNTVGEAYKLIKGRRANPAIGAGQNQSYAKAIGTAIAAGAATFLAPPVMIGVHAVRDYQDKRTAEMLQGQVGHWIGILKSKGLSNAGAAEIANLIVMNHTLSNTISQTDYDMWLIFANDAPDLGEYNAAIKRLVR